MLCTTLSLPLEYSFGGYDNYGGGGGGYGGGFGGGESLLVDFDCHIAFIPSFPPCLMLQSI